MSRKAPRVAVLGAGIMGSSVALFLARRGFEVTLIDAAPAPFSGASRWNEGKIHLGYLYAGDETRATASRLLPAGLRFKALTEELIGCGLGDRVTPADDVYLVHRNTVVEAAAVERHLRHVARLVGDHPEAGRYVVDASRSAVRVLDGREIAAIADPQQVLAGFAVRERSIETTWIADRFVEALAGEDRIVLAMDTRVAGVRRAGGSGADAGWSVACRPPIDTRFDAVVNALWEGSPAVDATVGLSPEAGWSHRYRLSLFVHTARPVAAPSAVLVTGPFGDIKNYDGRHFYLYWYDAGLMAEGRGIEPPLLAELAPEARQSVSTAIVERLGGLIPAATAVFADKTEARLEGGWVFAIGQGSLADRTASLHRRDRFGVRRLGTYFSVNTGKYSTAPWLARQLADEISAMLR
ncbi:MAG: FAD-dependent oxidoreductase [Bauldia sp.]